MLEVTPQKHQAPRLRYWLPGAATEKSVLRQQLEAVKAAGWGGVELAWLSPEIGDDKNPARYRYGSELWKEQFAFIVETATQLELQLDITVSASWPCQVPGLLPSAEQAAQELVCGVALLEHDSFSGKLPPPICPPSGQSPAFADLDCPLTVESIHIVRVLVNKDAEETKAHGPWRLAGAVEDCIARVQSQGNRLEWKAPAPSVESTGYLLVVSYSRGSAQHKSIWEKHNSTVYLEPRGCVIDHLDASGVGQVKKFYRQSVYTPAILKQLQSLQSSIFEDSLELHQTQFWTRSFIERFTELRGYDPTLYLPLLHEQPRPMAFSPHVSIIKFAEDLKGESAVRFIYDFKRTVSDLYLKEHIQALTAFANEPYEIDIDVGLAASLVDIPEGETLTFKGNRDAFRLLASGRDVGGRVILSDELAACIFEAYEMSWKKVIKLANLDFALGVNQIVLHGLPYAYTDKSAWPGYHPFNPKPPLPSFSDAWDERQPQWQFSPECTGYLARTQTVLQMGRALVDVAIFHPALKGIHAEWSDPTLTANGYSYGFLTDGLLSLPSAEVKQGRLFSNGPSYKCLILPEQEAMEADTVQSILRLARQGLGVIVVGQEPRNALGAVHASAEQDTIVRNGIEALLSLPNCRHIAAVSDLVETLRDLDINSSIAFTADENDQSEWLYVRRQTVHASWYYIHNASTVSATRTIKFAEVQDAAVSVFDAWTGNSRAMESSENGVSIYLPPSASIILYVSQIADTGSSAVRTSRSEEEVAVTDWTLEIEAWEPAYPEARGGQRSAETKKTTLGPFQLDGLQPWSSLPGAAGASGTGKYKTTVKIPDGCQTLQLAFASEQECVMRVKVNGEIIVGDAVGLSPVDISQAIRQEVHDLDIEIEVATTLVNQLRQLYPSTYGKRSEQKLGLLGVTLRYS